MYFEYGGVVTAIMAAEMTAIVASSGLVQNVAQSTSLAAKAGMLRTRQWLDRRRGLKLLKELPTGLEALVFGDDMSPELLAALSLGGSAGHELATLALLMTIEWETSHTLETCYNGLPESHLYHILGKYTTPLLTDPTTKPTRMNGYRHEVYLLDRPSSRMMWVHRFSMQTRLSLNTIAFLVVVGYINSPDGVVVCGSTDACFYYCENRFGRLKCSSVDTCSRGEPALDTMCTNFLSRVFTVTPEVLDSYHEFFRLCRLADFRAVGVRELLGLAELARSLGLRFARESTGDSSGPLLSREHLRNVHKRLGIERDPLQMPNFMFELVCRAGATLPLCDRAYERTRFGATQETTAAYEEKIKSLAETTGNVGVRATESAESCLIKSGVLGALGQEPSFAIFPRFSNSRVNIDVSPGCTAMYFPGLNITVAFPDGSATEAAEVRAFRPPCPFTFELSETMRILVVLAPIIAKGRLKKVAQLLGKELAADPSSVLDPVSENVVRSFATSIDELPAQHSLITLLQSSSLGEGRLHLEAALAGVLCQSGLNFNVAGGADMRCFFHCCHAAGWGVPRGNVGVVLVDCKIDISACILFTSLDGVFVGRRGTRVDRYYGKLVGPGLEGSRFDIQQGGNYHLEPTNLEVTCFPYAIPFGRKCYVGSSRPT